MSVTNGGPHRPRRRWIWAIVALVTAAVLILPVALLVSLKPGQHHEHGPVTVYHHAVTAVRVSAPGDTVAITAGRTGQVSVASTVGWLVTKPAIRERWHGTTLAVSVHCPARDLVEGCSASLIVRVPAATEVRTAVGAGTASVAGVAGPVRVIATSGSVVLAYLSGPVWATATSGSITGMTGLNSTKLVADVGSGSLALGLDTAPRSLSLAVGSGSGNVTVPPGTRCRIDTGRGTAVHVSPGMSSPDSAGLISAKAGSGTLSIVYPGGLPVPPPAAP
ncbi:MAG TPA: hypothetical protein VKB62_08375 [Streptosporangiaceae bacterium]|nr:hypothetical protein [Streptosporangiaceae bacterium]